MFELLSGKLGNVFRRLGDKGRLTGKDVKDAMREVRMALLEADVNYRVTRDLVARIHERAIDEHVLKSLSPGQQVIKIANEEMTEVLGGEGRSLIQESQHPSVMMLVGLNGSGKTTTAAKLALFLKQSGQQSVLVAADVRRPAAIQQLTTLGKQMDVTVYEDGTTYSAGDIVQRGVSYAKKLDAAWAILDTSGRFQVEDELMGELKEIKETTSVVETLLVVDAMTGQDAVDVAQEFHSRVGLTGIVLTKLDGDARGGAALSVVSVTGVPIKFIGVGERVDALEQFYPDRLASRILGMGDVLTLIEKAQTTFDKKEAMKLEKKIRHAKFDLEDFLRQLHQIRGMGPLSQLLEMVPGMSAMKGRVPEGEFNDDQFKKVEAVILSMTPEERRRPEIIKGHRRRRIANGSGTTIQDVNQLLNQFRHMQKIMRQMASGKGMANFMRVLK